MVRVSEPGILTARSAFFKRQSLPVFHVVVLPAMLLFLAHNAAGAKAIDTLHQMLAAIRKRLGIMQPRRPNTSRHTYGTKPSSK